VDREIAIVEGNQQNAMPTIEPNRLRPGMKIVVDGQLWVVTDFQLRTPGNLRSFVVCKIKNIKDGRQVEKTWRGGNEAPEQADVETRTAQYLYTDGHLYTFMDTSTYEQFELESGLLGERTHFLVPDAEVQVAFWNGAPIDAVLPQKMDFTVTETVGQVARGNSSGNITKNATIETGHTLQVPTFIQQGEKIRVNTETGEYVERA
jgi:elongation factor P